MDVVHDYQSDALGQARKLDTCVPIRLYLEIESTGEYEAFAVCRGVDDMTDKDNPKQLSVQTINEHLALEIENILVRQAVVHAHDAWVYANGDDDDAYDSWNDYRLEEDNAQ